MRDPKKDLRSVKPIRVSVSLSSRPEKEPASERACRSANGRKKSLSALPASSLRVGWCDPSDFSLVPQSRTSNKTLFASPSPEPLFCCRTTNKPPEKEAECRRPQSPLRTARLVWVGGFPRSARLPWLSFLRNLFYGYYTLPRAECGSAPAPRTSLGGWDSAGENGGKREKKRDEKKNPALMFLPHPSDERRCNAVMWKEKKTREMIQATEARWLGLVVPGVPSVELFWGYDFVVES